MARFGIETPDIPCIKPRLYLVLTDLLERSRFQKAPTKGREGDARGRKERKNSVARNVRIRKERPSPERDRDREKEGEKDEEMNRKRKSRRRWKSERWGGI